MDTTKHAQNKTVSEDGFEHWGQVDNNLFMCDICGQEGLTEIAMRSHVLLEHVESQISCPFCDLEGTTLEEMTIHVNAQHLDILKPSSDENGKDNAIRKNGNISEVSNATAGMDQVMPKAKMTPKRARLHLEVPIVTVEKPPNNPEQDSDYSCPLCGWISSKSDEMTRHVNVAHLDALTPTKGPRSSAIDLQNNNAMLECPLCGWRTEETTTLELHVYQTHRDELGSPGQASISSLSPSLVCPVCAIECANPENLMKHVDGHFSSQHTPSSDQEVNDHLLAQELQAEQRQTAEVQEKHEFEQLQEKYGMKGNNNYKKQAEKSLENAVMKGQLSITDFYVKRHQVLEADTTGVDDGHSCTKGIIQCLHKYYAGMPNGIQRYWLCSAVDHYASSYGDKGWGCGYRNLQMILSALAKDDTFTQSLFNGRPSIPSLPKIQRLIETAWQKGFDPAGCEQLGGKVVNTSKWIGATEIVATLSSLKVQCQLVDFHTPTGEGNTHPKLFEWVCDYFAGDEKFKAPLYLQHQGHSRTIIGLEKLKDSSLRLLLFDPSCRTTQMQQFSHDISANLMRTLRRPLHTLKARQYQVVAVRGVLSDAEYQESKLLKSEQIP